MKEVLEKEIREYCKNNKIEILRFSVTSQTQTRAWNLPIKFDFVGKQGLNNLELRFSTEHNMSGCGSMLVYGYHTYYLTEEIAPIFDIVAKIYAKHDVGCLITTQGGSRGSNKIATLEKLGFTVLSEYPNLHHAHNRSPQCLLQRLTDV